MITSQSTFEAIEAAAIAAIQTANPNIEEVDPDLLSLMGIAEPSVAAKVLSVNVERFTNSNFKFTTRLAILVAVSDLSSGQARRAAVYPLVMGAIGVLAGQKLGLDIHPLRPERILDVTPPDLEETRHAFYQIDFVTWFYEELPTPEEGVRLLGFINQFFMDNAETATAEDAVTINTIPADPGDTDSGDGSGEEAGE